MIVRRDQKANGHEPGRSDAGRRAQADRAGRTRVPSETPVCVLREAWASFVVKGREILPAHGESVGFMGDNTLIRPRTAIASRDKHHSRGRC